MPPKTSAAAACCACSQILHLDLKPQNVLLASDNTPWVTDFGLSASLGSSGSSTAGAAVRGTFAYKPPEAFRTKKTGGALVTEATDVYAFGMLSWQVLTRQEPWADSPITEIMTSGPAFVALPPEKQRCGSCGAAVVVLIIAQ